MVSRAPDGFFVDPEDPRAPSQELWDRMSPDERARVVASLPVEVPEELCAPEGDAHFDAKADVRRLLRDFYNRAGRKVYISSEIGVYYPDEPRFSPDVLAVLDVEPHDRDSWVVSKEGKGLDFVMEVTWHGDRRKDFETNVERYARLGITEYFIFDRAQVSLRGYRLAASRARYVPIVPQHGQYESHVLGLRMMLEGNRLRFWSGTASIAEPEEVISRLGDALDQVISRQQELERALEQAQDKLEEERRAREEERRAREEERRAREEERRAREEAERKLAEALAELERLRKGG